MPYSRYARNALLACLLCLGAFPACAQELSAQVRAHFAAARRAQVADDLEEAARQYRQVTRLAPGLAEAYVNLGLVEFALNDFSGAIDALTKADRHSPGLRGVRLYLGIAYLRLHKPEAALPLLHDAVRQDPHNADAQSWLATALWDNGESDAALRQLRAAQEMFPDNPDILYSLGEAYSKAARDEIEQLMQHSSETAIYDLVYAALHTRQANWTQAERHLRRAVARDPKLMEARLRLIDVLIEQGQAAAAQREIESAEALDPKSPAVLARSGLVQLLEGQVDRGATEIGEALRFDSSEALDALRLPPLPRLAQHPPGDVLQTLCNSARRELESSLISGSLHAVSMAALDERAGDEQAADAAYAQAHVSRSAPLPSTAQAMQQAGRALSERRYADAETLYLRWLKGHPDDGLARFYLALTRGAFSEEQLTNLLAVAPDSYHVHQLLGQLYQDSQDDNRAMDEYRAVLAQRPDLPGMYFRLGHLAWKHGDFATALEELRAELKLDADNAEANGELGSILVEEGNAAEAVPYLERAIRLQPTLWPVYAQLGRAYAQLNDNHRAEQCLVRALEHDTDGAVFYQYGRVLRTEGKLAEARQAFEKARQLKNEGLPPSTTGAVKDEGEPR